MSVYLVTLVTASNAIAPEQIGTSVSYLEYGYPNFG